MLSITSLGRSEKRGFTLVELLIIIAIISMLAVFVFINLRGQSAKAYDAKRKTDLYNMRKAVEEYFNDHNAFPPLGTNEHCGGTDLVPYLASIPCDPETKLPYGYFFSRVSDGCRLCAILANNADPAITNTGCDPVRGCGVGSGYNYCVASGVSPSAIGTADEVASGATPTAGAGATNTPTPTIGSSNLFACAPADSFGVSSCNHYADPVGSGCPVSFTNSACSNACGNSANWCAQ